MKKIQNSHNASVEMSFDNIESAQYDGTFVVRSSDDARNYFLKKIKEVCNCFLTCEKCDVCVHLYECTCTDYLLYTNICKHIHLLCRFNKMQGNILTGDDDTEVQLSREQTIESEVQEMLPLVNSNDNSGDFESLR